MKGRILYLYHWKFVGGEEFGLYEDREDAQDKVDESGSPWAEVISLIVL